MQRFLTLTDRVVPLPTENIDTDQIIPARFLKSTNKQGFGNHVFYDWRFNKDGSENENFVLNNPNYQGQVLIAGNNFGCGSSREHAAWALAGYNFKVIISSYFADIFKGNALNNGVLPIQVSDEFLRTLLEYYTTNPKSEVTINLKNQTLLTEVGQVDFEIDAYKKMCLINGYDDIDFLLSKQDKIKEYEANKKISFSKIKQK